MRSSSSDQSSSQDGDQESLQSSDEILTLRQRLDACKTRLIKYVVENTLCCLERKFVSMQRDGGTSASFNPVGDTGAGACQTSKGKQRERKRKVGQAGGNAGDDEDNTLEERNSKGLMESDSGGLLACPFFKHDTAKYKAHRACCGPGWGTVHRIKYVTTPRKLSLWLLLMLSIGTKGTCLPKASPT